MDNGSKEQPRMTAGLDLGDRYSYLCLIDTESGEVIEEGRLRTSPEALRRRFASEPPLRVAIEAGTHSPWVSRVLEECAHEVLVANARKLRLIYGEGRKTDKLDAEKLARLARLDPKLLAPLKHRGEASQAHLVLIHSREALVRTRSRLINHVRATVKSFGARLPKCSAYSFHEKVTNGIPQSLGPALEPLLETIGELTDRIREYDCKLEAVAKEFYPETELLRQIQGVGPLTALAFVVILEDPSRFGTGRSVGAYAGLVPGKDQSGEHDPQQRISRRGNELLRRLLVGCAQYILGPFGEDSDLRRHGEKICERGGKNARKRAVVAVARKLSVLLHHLWTSGEIYEPLYNARRAENRAA
ncbi:MAG: IS110 family transposase [Actinomycetota bacterium]|nr:IS110 family transposase [Actinomycetota bacterium]